MLGVHRPTEHFSQYRLAPAEHLVELLQGVRDGFGLLVQVPHGREFRRHLREDVLVCGRKQLGGDLGTEIRQEHRGFSNYRVTPWSNFPFHR